MDLGLDFDDEDFVATSKTSTENGTKETYTVKEYKPEWFEKSLKDINVSNSCSRLKLASDEIPHAFKMSGDNHYYKKNYKMAIEQYQSALALLPNNNVCVRQDVTESLSRSYMQVGQAEESYKLASDLVKQLSTQDEARQRQSLILLSFVCKSSGRWAECIECLEKLCNLQPLYAQFWSQLGDAYSNYENSLASDSVSNDVVNCQFRKLTCYVRAKLLHQSVLGTSSAVIRNRNLQLIREIQQKIDSIPLSEADKTLTAESVQVLVESQSGVDGT